MQGCTYCIWVGRYQWGWDPYFCLKVADILCLLAGMLFLSWFSWISWWFYVLKAGGWIVGNHYSYTYITGTTYWSASNRPMTTHFLGWRPYHVTLCNLLNTVYLHTVHDTHALQGKSDFIPHLSSLLFISLNFYSHITYISFITVTICSHSTDDALHIFYADTVNQMCNF